KQYTIKYLSLLAVLTSMCLYAVKQASAQQAEPAATAVADTTASVRDTLAIEEVQVNTGYQRIPKERATGSFVFVDSALLNRAVSTDIISRLKGVVPSLLFDERAGGEPKLSIRGRSTIFANADPLIVVDNFPYEGDIRNINPNDVESVSILRDAAAASIWGVRAGNGVIVITTKKGKAGQPLQVSFNGNVTVGEKPDLWYEPRISTSDLVDVQEFLYEKKFYNSNLANTRTFPVIPPVVEVLADDALSENERLVLLDGFRREDIRIDLERYFYRPQINQQFALRMSGGTERNRYTIGGGYDENRTSLVGNNNKRLTLSSGQILNIIPKLTISSDIVFASSINSRNNALADVSSTFPYLRLVDASGKHLSVPRDFRMGFVDAAEEKGLLNWLYIPLDELALAEQGHRQQDLRINSRVAYELLPGLVTELFYQFEKQTTNLETHNREETYFIRNLINRFSVINVDGSARHQLPRGDYLEQGWRELHAHNTRFQLTYQLKKAKHDIVVLAGGEIRHAIGNHNNRMLYGFEPSTGLAKAVNFDSLYSQYPLGGVANIPGAGGLSSTTDRFRSVYANASYTLFNKYTFSSSARIDQSNLFGVNANQRSIPLWSVGAKWTVSDDLPYQSKWLNKMDLRTTYGFNGNIDNRASAYTTARYVNDFATGLHYAYIIGMPNANLRYEKSSILNVAVDFSMFNGFLNGSIEYYAKKAKDLLGYGPLDPTVGATSYYGNMADIAGSGLDIEVGLKSKGRAIQWSGTLFFSHSTEKVTKYENKPTSLTSYFRDASLSGGAVPIIGKPLFGIYSYPWAGLDPLTGSPQGYIDGKPSMDYAAIVASYEMDSLVFHGSATPTWNGAMRQTLHYRNWTFSFAVTGQFGYYFRRPSLQYLQLFNGIGGHADYAKRWQQAGDEMITNVPSMTYPASGARDEFYANASILVEKGDHVRLQDIRMDYRYNWIQVFGYVNNVCVLWRANRHGIDPAFASGVLPAPLQFSFGISLHF
ncbi:MAG TPA: SusC/RagA family TonB-linked outer membrane protein, partial [Parapedobacter sp.]|nr:SusC/RagA family TonB-linked outer membrane protein [Parapedobacter sp.]